MSTPLLQPSTRFAPITYGVAPKDYQALGTGNELARGNPNRVMSRSDLREFAKCPRKWILGTERKETDAMDFGTLVDGLTLARHEFDQRFAVHPTMYQSATMKCPKCGSVTDSKACRACKCDRIETTVEKDWNWNSTTCIEWADANSGRVIVSPDKLEKASKAVIRLAEDEVTGPFVADCKTEVQICVDYTDPATGLVVTLKMLLDLVPNAGGRFAQSLGDLKTTFDARPAAWRRRIFDDGLHYQGAIYSDGYNAATGEQRFEFRHIISESAAPYEPAARFLSHEFIELGRVEYMADLALYCRCLKAGNFPGYTGGTKYGGWQIAEPEAWMIERAMSATPAIELPPEESTTEPPPEETVP